MPLQVETNTNLQEILNRLEMLGSGVFPETAKAINISSSFVLRTWVNIAQGQDQSGKPPSVNFSGSIDYANSIRVVSMSPFHKVVTSDSKIGERLQNGSPEYDMKPALVTGPRSRKAADGSRYNIIPFRHKTRDLKKRKIGSDNAYGIANALTQQKVIGFRIDNEGKRRMVYAKWTADKKLSTKDRFMAGMVRMSVGTTGETRSHYLTFRVVRLDQVGKWTRKAQAAWDINGQVRDKTEAKIQAFVKMAIARDLGLE